VLVIAFSLLPQQFILRFRSFGADERAYHRAGRLLRIPFRFFPDNHTQVTVVPFPQNAHDARQAAEVDIYEGSVELPFAFERKESVILHDERRLPNTLTRTMRASCLRASVQHATGRACCAACALSILRLRWRDLSRST
jgi:hypothetical protein